MTTSRRAILASPAAAPVAGLPAIAEAFPCADPVLAAIAELRILRARVGVAREAYDHAEEAFFNDQEKPVFPVKFGGVEIFNIEQLEREFTVGRLSLYRLDSKFATELRAELVARLERQEQLERRHGYSQAGKALAAEESAMWDMEDAILDLAPTTPDGAIELLRFVDDFIADREGSDAEKPPVHAIRRAIAGLSAASGKEERHA